MDVSEEPNYSCYLILNYFTHVRKLINSNIRVQLENNFWCTFVV